jgi:predicted PurR-regulated permease PerM
LSDEAQRVGLVATRVGAGLLLLAGAYLVLRPFLVGLIWAAIIAYVTWPLFGRARRWSGRPVTVAALFTLAIFLLVVVPVSWFLVTLAEQVTSLVIATQGWIQAGAPLPDWLYQIPWLGERISDLRADLPAFGDVASHLARFGGQLSQRLVGIASGAASNVFSFLVMLIALFSFYVDGEGLTGHARRLSGALFPTRPEFVDDVGEVVRAVVFGLVGTALVQGIMAAIGLAIFGVPSAVAFGALTSVLSFVPAGPPLVWGGAALWLFLEGHVGSAIGMALWGLLLVSSIDNVLRPVLISRVGTAPIPFLVVFFGVIGGLAAFGLLGLFLGPVVLSVTFALISRFPVGETEQTAPQAPTAD